MSFAFSFGRMGLDFRPLIHDGFSHIIIDIFRRKMDIATKSFTSLKKLELIDDDIFENTRHQLDNEATQEDLSVLSAPLELCIWDDLCVYGNSIIDALNETRHSISINFVIQLYRTIFSSFYSIFAWLDSLLSKSEEVPVVRRATHLLLRYFVPYINRCFFHCFPYDQCLRLYYRAGYCSVEEYKEAFSFMKSDLFALCRQNLLSDIFEEVLKDAEKIQHLMEITGGEEKLNEVDEHLKNNMEDESVLAITD